MEINITRLDDAFHFRSTNSKGASVDTDLQPESGGSGDGVSPLELLVASLGCCTGVDVVSILKKGKQQLDDFDVAVTAERDGGKPISMITAIHVKFELTGDIDPAKAARAIKLSAERYCTVTKILEATIAISTSFTVNGVLYDN
ncbi:MAG: OsmC family protein [Rhodothermales bacterium]|nr:OsmC family protein [Rhodothermales bacterium]